jgi:hypothetical protein
VRISCPRRQPPPLLRTFRGACHWRVY